MQTVQHHKYQLKNNPMRHGSPVKPKSYWIDSVGIEGIKRAYKVPSLRNILKDCVLDAHIPAKIYRRVTNENFT
jgi:hypothetical protein